MDRHDVSDEVTAENVAELHQADLKIQHDYNCKGLTYWFDGKRKTAFCLIEAPDKESIKLMHDNAHGEVPNRIIEVDGSIVESFLGRIEDPKKSQRSELNIINDPAFRTIMIAEIKHVSLLNFNSETVNSLVTKYHDLIISILNSYSGKLVKHKPHSYLASFESVTNAVACAIEIQSRFRTMAGKPGNSDLKLNIGLSAGVPVTEKEGLFEDTIKTAERLCLVNKEQVSVSSEVMDLYESENLNNSIDKEYINTFSPNDEQFLNQLIDYTEQVWTETSLNADSLSKNLGFSKSQLYRKLISIIGLSPNNFIRNYRLEKALDLLNKKTDNINLIAYETGFNTPAYFSKCFLKTYGILPSGYSKQLRSELT